MKLKERALAVLLSMVMVLTFMPAMTFAEGELTEAPGEVAADSESAVPENAVPVEMSVALAQNEEGTGPRELTGYVGEENTNEDFPGYGDKLTIKWSNNEQSDYTYGYDEALDDAGWLDDSTGEILESDENGWSFGWGYGPQNNGFEDDGTGYSYMTYSYSYQDENGVECQLRVRLIEDPIKSITFHQARPLVVYDHELTEGWYEYGWEYNNHFIQKGDYAEVEQLNEAGKFETVRYNAELVSVSGAHEYYLEDAEDNVLDMVYSGADPDTKKISLHQNGRYNGASFEISYVNVGEFPYKGLKFIPVGGEITLLAEDLYVNDGISIMERGAFPRDFFIDGDVLRLTDVNNTVSEYRYSSTDDTFVNTSDNTYLIRDDMIEVYLTNGDTEVGDNDTYIKYFDLESEHFNAKVIDDCSHDSVSPVEATDPTCGEPGVMAHYVCDNCGKKLLYDEETDEYYEVSDDALSVQPTGNHNLTPKSGKASTCEEKGYESYYECEVCGKLFSDPDGVTEISEPVVIPKARHTLSGTAAKEATCTEAGNTAYWQCSVCNRFFSDEEGKTEIEENSWVIAPLGHDYGEWTKLDDEKHQRVCSHNSEHVEYEAHSWDDGEITKRASDTEEGEKTYTCSVCEGTKTEIIATIEPVNTKVEKAIGVAEDAIENNEDDSAVDTVIADAEEEAGNAVNVANDALEAAKAELAQASTDEEKAAAQAKVNAAQQNVADAEASSAKVASVKAKVTAKRSAATASAKQAAASAQASSGTDAAVAAAQESVNAANAAKKAADDAVAAAEAAVKAAEATGDSNAVTAANKALKAATDAQTSAASALSAAQGTLGTAVSARNAAIAAASQPVEIIDLPAVKISKPKAAKKKLTVKWKKVSKKNQKKISGIQIQVATDPGFTNIVKTVTAGKKKTSKKISGLQKKTKYYVRIRAYAPGNHYSVWKTKKGKTK